MIEQALSRAVPRIRGAAMAGRAFPILVAAMLATSAWGCGGGGPQVDTNVPRVEPVTDYDPSKPQPKGMPEDPRIDAEVDPKTGRLVTPQ